jgi:hypothetical protein
MVIEAGKFKIKVLVDLLVWLGPISWFINNHLYAMFSHGRKGNRILGSSFIRTLISFGGGVCRHDLISSPLKDPTSGLVE